MKLGDKTPAIRHKERGDGMKSVENLKENTLLRYVDRDMYDAKGFVDYIKLRSNLNIKVKTLATAIGRTTRAIEKNSSSENIQKGLRKIVFILSLLKEMLGSKEEAHIWIKAPNPEFGGISPMDVIARGESEAVIDYLMDIKKGALT
jgi:hypothetical protein